MISLNAEILNLLFPQQPELVNFEINGVVIDSRKHCSGCLFIAIKGENFDGHDFVSKAQEKGAVAVMVEHEVNVSVPQIIVEDCRKAMARLASYWRKQVNPKLVAITGSNGKTTVKEMLGRILASQQQTLVTQGNLNNDIGVPLTLFGLSAQHRFAVIEMGANHLYEIKNLVQIAQPDVVYVNNAHSAHVEGFGSRQNVIRAKGEMYEFCPDTSIAVFNEDEDAVDYWKSIVNTSEHLSFSLRQQSDVTASFTLQHQTLHINLTHGPETADTEIQLQGLHNVQNATAAITLAKACGLTLQEAAEGLGGFSGVLGRQQFVRGLHQSLMIDDSYNANPDSLMAAINVLCAQPGIAWLALGDMAELGEQSLEMHEQAVTFARKAGVVEFFALGEQACKAASIFESNGYCFSSHDEMARYLAPRLHKDVNLLIKGSRSARMERLVDALKQIANSSGDNHAV